MMTCLNMISDSDSEEEIQVIEPEDPLALESELKFGNVAIEFKQEELDIPADDCDWLEVEEEEEEEEERVEEEEEKLENPLNPDSQQNLNNADDGVITLISDDEEDAAVNLSNGGTCNVIGKSAGKKLENLENCHKERDNECSKNSKQVIKSTKSAQLKTAPTSSFVVKSEFEKSPQKSADDEQNTDEIIIGDYDYPSDDDYDNLVAIESNGSKQQATKQPGVGKRQSISGKSNEGEFQCDKCDRSCKSAHGLRRHQMVHYNLSNCQFSDKISQVTKRYLECEFCNLKYVKHHNFLRHMHMNHPEKLQRLDTSSNEQMPLLKTSNATTNNSLQKNAIIENGQTNRSETTGDRLLNGPSGLVGDSDVPNKCSLQVINSNSQKNVILEEGEVQKTTTSLTSDRLMNGQSGRMVNGSDVRSWQNINSSLQKNVVPEKGQTNNRSQNINGSLQKNAILEKGQTNRSFTIGDGLLNGPSGLVDVSDVPNKRRKIMPVEPVVAMKHAVTTTQAATTLLTNQQIQTVAISSNPPTAFPSDSLQSSSTKSPQTQLKPLVKCKPPADLHKKIIKTISVPSHMLLDPSNKLPLDNNKGPLLLIVNMSSQEKSSLLKSDNVCVNVAPTVGLTATTSSGLITTSSSGGLISTSSSGGLITTSSSGGLITTTLSSGGSITTPSSVKNLPTIYCAPASHLFAPPPASEDVPQPNTMHNSVFAKCSTSAVVTPNGKSVIVSRVDSVGLGPKTTENVHANSRLSVAAANCLPGNERTTHSNIVSNSMTVGHLTAPNNNLPVAKTSQSDLASCAAGLLEPKQEVCNSDPIFINQENAAAINLHNPDQVFINQENAAVTNEHNLVITSTMSLSSSNPFSVFNRLCENFPTQAMSHQPSPLFPNCNSATPLPPTVIQAKLHVGMDIDDQEVLPWNASSGDPPLAKVRKIDHSASAPLTLLPAPHTVLPASRTVLPAPHTVLPASLEVMPTPHTVLPASHTVLPTPQTVLPASHTVLPTSLPVVASTGLPTASSTESVISIRKVVNFATAPLSLGPQVVAPDSDDDDIVEIGPVSILSPSLPKTTCQHLVSPILSVRQNPIHRRSSNSSATGVCSKKKSPLSNDDTEDDCVIVEEIPKANKQESHNDTSGKVSVSNNGTKHSVVINAGAESSNRSCKETNNNNYLGISMTDSSLAKTSSIPTQLNSVHTFVPTQKQTSSGRRLMEQNDENKLKALIEDEIRKKTEELKMKYQDLKMISDRIKLKSKSLDWKCHSEEVICCQSCPESEFVKSTKNLKSIQGLNHVKLVEDIIHNSVNKPVEEKQTAVDLETSCVKRLSKAVENKPAVHLETSCGETLSKAVEEKLTAGHFETSCGEDLSKPVEMKVGNKTQSEVEVEVIDLEMYEMDCESVSKTCGIVCKDGQNISGNPQQGSSANPEQDKQDTSATPVQHSSSNPEQDTSATPVQDSSATPGQDSSANPGQDSSANPRQDSSTNSHHVNEKILDLSNMLDYKNLSEASINILSNIDKFLEQVYKKDSKIDGNYEIVDKKGNINEKIVDIETNVGEHHVKIDGNDCTIGINLENIDQVHKNDCKHDENDVSMHETSNKCLKSASISNEGRIEVNGGNSDKENDHGSTNSVKEVVTSSIIDSNMNSSVMTAESVEIDSKLNSSVKTAEPVEIDSELNSSMKTAEPVEIDSNINSSVKPVEPVEIDSNINSSVKTAEPVEIESKLNSSVKTAEPVEIDFNVNSSVKTAEPVEIDSNVNSSVMTSEPVEIDSNINSSVKTVEPVEIDSNINSSVKTVEPVEIDSELNSFVTTAEPVEIDSNVNSSVKTAEPVEIESKQNSSVKTAEPVEIDSKLNSSVKTVEPVEIDSNVNSSVKTADPVEIESNVNRSVRIAEPVEIDSNVNSSVKTVEPVEIDSKLNSYVKTVEIDYKLNSSVKKVEPVGIDSNVNSSVKTAEPVEIESKLNSSVKTVEPVEIDSNVNSSVKTAEPVEIESKLNSSFKTAEPVEIDSKLNSCVKTAEPVEIDSKLNSCVKTAEPVEIDSKLNSSIKTAEPVER